MISDSSWLGDGQKNGSKKWLIRLKKFLMALLILN